MGGGYSFDYKPLTIKECITILDAMPIGTRIIIKPTVNSDSGRGVELYEKDNSSKFFHLRGDKLILLDSERLDSIGRNIIIQEAMIQSDYISQFNASSINTIRIATYRSVCDENIHILSSVIRIGKAGSIVDNGHSGGKMVRILDDGTLDKYCSDQYGNHKTSHNGIDFCKNVYRIPQWENVLKFAKEVSSKILHARLVQLDIMLDSNNTPHLIEFNITGFSMWQAQFTGTPAFGNLTDEVREYTIANLK